MGEILLSIQLHPSTSQRTLTPPLHSRGLHMFFWERTQPSGSQQHFFSPSFKSLHKRRRMLCVFKRLAAFPGTGYCRLVTRRRSVAYTIWGGLLLTESVGLWRITALHIDTGLCSLVHTTALLMYQKINMYPYSEEMHTLNSTCNYNCEWLLCTRFAFVIC